MRILSIEPTVFFVRTAEGLRQQVRLRVECPGAARLILAVRGGGLEDHIPLPELGAGASECAAYIPDVRTAMRLDFSLLHNGRLECQKAVEWQPMRHWEVYLVHYSHHDLGYTDLPSSVLREHARILDEVLRYCEETQEWPEGDRFHWLAEQAWSVVHFVETRPKQDVERLMQAIRRGQVEVTALFGNQTAELCGHEQLIRLLYPSFKLKREYGIEIVSAEHNDIPGMPWGLASVLAGTGVRYFSPGIPASYFGSGDERVHPLWDEKGVLSLDHPGAFWWEGIDGSRVLVWYDIHGHEWHPTSYEQALRDLPGMLGTLGQHGYLYDMVSYTVRGGHRDNAPAIDRYAYLARQWNSHWAYPRLINAHNKRFLREFERRWGSTLKTLRGDVPGTDYPVGATCTPKETGINRETHDRLLAGEKWATVASVVAEYDYPKAALDEAYRLSTYFDEHAWGNHQVIGPAQDACWSEKSAFAYRAAALAHDVVTKAANRITDQISYREEALYLTVLNHLSWEHTGVVRAPLRQWNFCGLLMHWQEPRKPGDGPVMNCGGAIGREIINPPARLLDQPFELIDVTSGERIPYQLARVANPQAAVPWAAERVALGEVDRGYTADIVFVADELPPLGYRTYKITPCEKWPEYAADCPVNGSTVENRFFRLELDSETGAIARLVDKELSRDLVDPEAAHGLAGILARCSKTGQQYVGRATDISVIDCGPVLTTVQVNGSVVGCPCWTLEISLYQAVKRIDTNIRVLRDSTPLLEHYVAFPFQIADPSFRYEATGTVIQPLRDQLPGTCTDYYAAQHWVHLCNEQQGIVWAAVDAPMVELGGLRPGYVSSAHHGVRPPGYGHPFLTSRELCKGHIYSLLMYSNYRTNFSNVHPGEALFRYSFSSDGSRELEEHVSRFGWEVANPPLPVWMQGCQRGSLPPSGSFCQIDAPNAMLLTLKRAEDGRGFILRLLETEGRDAEVVVSLPLLDIVQAYSSNLVEENESLLPCTRHSVHTRLAPYSFRTIRLVTRDWPGF
jgi:hypothetical protein